MEIMSTFTVLMISHYVIGLVSVVYWVRHDEREWDGASFCIATMFGLAAFIVVIIAFWNKSILKHTLMDKLNNKAGKSYNLLLNKAEFEMIKAHRRICK